MLRRLAAAATGALVLGLAPVSPVAAGPESEPLPLDQDYVPPPAPAEAASNSSGAAPVVGDGFITFDPGDGYTFRDDDSFVLRLVANHQGNVEALRTSITRAAAQVSGISGVTIGVAAGTVPDGPGDREPAVGEILLSVDATSPCGRRVAGCAGPQHVSHDPRTGIALIRGGRIWIDPVVLGYTRPQQDHVTSHELGHVLGLAHFNGSHPDGVQVMNGTTAGYGTAGTYRAGDSNGLRFIHPEGRPWNGLGGVTIGDPDVASWGSGRLDVFAVGSDNALWHRYFQGGWSPWVSLGGRLTGGPTAVSWGPGRLDVFARGVDNALWRISYSGGWSGWSSLGGRLTSDPDAASWGQGRLDVFARGADNALWHISYSGSWSGWSARGGTITSSPAAVSRGPNRIDVFARGTDNALWHLPFAGGWGGWASRGGSLTSSPDVSSWGADRLDVFARGTDNALWHLPFGGAWGPWQRRGGVLSSGPGAVSWGPGRIDVVVRGTDNSLYHRFYEGTW